MKKQLTKRILVAVLSIAAVTGSLGGCSKESGSVSSSSPSPFPTESKPTLSSSVANPSSAAQDEKPVDITWYQINRASSVAKSMDEIRAFQEIAKATNINLTFEHPAAGSNSNEQINLLIASNALPDIIFWNWKSMPGGITKYVEEDVAIPLNDLDTPYYDAVLDKYPECKKYAYLEDGVLPAFYQLDPDPQRTTYGGFVVRQDWLKKLGLEIPETIDDWHNVLTAIKTQDPNGNGQNDELPYMEQKGGNLSSFAAAYGVLPGLCYDPATGKVVYGPAQSSYKEFLLTMNQWYSEGLIDPEFATNDSKQFIAKIQNELAGTWTGTINKAVGNNILVVRETNPDFSNLGITAPKKNADGIPYSPKSDALMKLGESGIITSSSQNPQAAARLLDYCYSEEGNTLLNWGIEGESYEVVNGEKKFTDKIMHPEDNEAPTAAIMRYALPATGSSKVMDFAAASQVQYIYQESFDSIANWMKSDTSLMIHPNLQYTADESAQIANIINECTTYHDEMVLKFILGTENIEEKFDSFVEEFKKMNIDQAVKLTQDSVDRMNAR